MRAALISNYSLNRQHTIQIQMLKVCIKLHSDNDTQNFYLKHYQGLEYLNMAIAQVTDNPTIAGGPSIHQQAKQQLHDYIRTYIQPLIQTGKQMNLNDILHHVTIRRPKLVQQLGNQQVHHMLSNLIEVNQLLSFIS